MVKSCLRWYELEQRSNDTVMLDVHIPRSRASLHVPELPSSSGRDNNRLKINCLQTGHINCSERSNHRTAKQGGSCLQTGHISHLQLVSNTCLQNCPSWHAPRRKSLLVNAEYDRYSGERSNPTQRRRPETEYDYNFAPPPGLLLSLSFICIVCDSPNNSVPIVCSLLL